MYLTSNNNNIQLYIISYKSNMPFIHLYRYIPIYLKDIVQQNFGFSGIQVIFLYDKTIFYILDQIIIIYNRSTLLNNVTVFISLLYKVGTPYME